MFMCCGERESVYVYEREGQRQTDTPRFTDISAL